MPRSAVFMVKLSRPTTQSVSVNYATVPDSAVAPGDFTSVSGTITFAPGQTIAQVIVPIVDPVDGEPEEKFTLALSSPVNATLANASGTCTIPEKNPTEFPVVSVNDVSGRTIVYTVSLSKAHSVQASISYSTQSRTAIAGQDFTAVNGTLVFAPGETSKTVSVPVLAKSDRDLSLKLALANPSKLTLYRIKTGIGTITPDSDVVTKVNAAKAAKTAYETAVSEAAAAKAAMDQAWSEMDAAVAAYNTAVDAQNVSIADLAAKESNVAHCQQVLTNTQINAMNFAGNASAAALVVIATTNLNNATADRNAAQTTLTNATALVATRLTEKNTKTTAYNNAVSTNTTKQNAVTTTKATADSAKAIAAAAFVGSTKLEL